MRPGQAPRNLESHPKRGWLYLGKDGWYGSMSREDISVVKEFFKALGGYKNMPGYHYEWVRVQELLEDR
jgi:hypothetical protein